MCGDIGEWRIVLIIQKLVFYLCESGDSLLHAKETYFLGTNGMKYCLGAGKTQRILNRAYGEGRVTPEG